MKGKKTLIILFAAAALTAVLPLIYFAATDAAFLNKNEKLRPLADVAVYPGEIELIEVVKSYLSKDEESAFYESNSKEMFSAAEKFFKEVTLSQKLKDYIDNAVNNASSVTVYETLSTVSYYLLNGDNNGEISELQLCVEKTSGSVISFYAVLKHVDDLEIVSRQTAKDYLKYTSLDTLNDWTFDGQRYYSKKAGLYLNVETDGENGMVYLGLEL